jgi:uncharacterized protein YneF (UPF0154 family)
MDTESSEEETKEETEAENTSEQDPEAEEEKPKGPREPNNIDYLAGAMLANGIIWIWMQALSLIGEDEFVVLKSLLTGLSFIIYIFGGYYAASQVCKRSDTQHLIVGLKTAGYASVMALVIMLTMINQLNLGIVLSISISLLAGGVLGGYMHVRKRLQRRRLELEASS